MDLEQRERLRFICRMLIKNDKALLAFKAIWLNYKVQKLVDAKKRHNRKQAKLLQQSIKLNNEIRVQIFNINMKDL